MNPIKNILKYIVYSVRDLGLANASSPVKKENSLVIVRMDAIGDYILFRNFIEQIANSKKYKDFHITLVGNKLWKPIAELLDSEWVDRFIWVDSRKFQKDFPYRKQKILELKDTDYTILFHPTYSPDYYVAEKIVEIIPAESKIGVNGKLNNIAGWQRSLSDKSYTFQIDVKEFPLFEFEKNKLISELFLKSSTSISKPTIKADELPKIKSISSDYILLFIGGGEEFRKWSIGNWIKLISELLHLYKVDIIISGGPDDKENALLIKNHFISNDRVIDYCGKTSLTQLISIIAQATFIVSNETSAAHIAVSLDTPVCVISNGNYYGRFTPYPKSITEKYAVAYPPLIEKNKNKEELLKRYSEGSDIPIDAIKPNVVLDKINEIHKG